MNGPGIAWDIFRDYQVAMLRSPHLNTWHGRRRLRDRSRYTPHQGIHECVRRTGGPNA